MGYDCTLHLIDEPAIRDEFVPRLLGLLEQETALDRVLSNAPELWDKVRNSLAHDDPESAASLLCQLAVTFSACSLPHQYERGFALSLWQDQEGDLAVEFPAHFVSSPEPLFAAVVQKYPAMHGRFPDWFTGNYSTGVFIPSSRVPEVLAWVEQRVEKYEKGDRRNFKGLLGILRAAADKHLAYWEATDLAVPLANEFPGKPALMMARYLGNEPTSPAKRMEESPLTAHSSGLSRSIVDHFLICGDDSPFETSLWDLSVWPPKFLRTHPEFATRAARSRTGRWMLMSETRADAETRSFQPRLFSDIGKPADGDFRVTLNGTERNLEACAFFGDRPLVFLDVPNQAKVGDMLPPPLWLVDGQWKPLPGLPDVPARPSALPRYVQDPVIGVVQLPDESDVVIWDGDGYEWRGDRFEKTFDMQARKPEQYFSAVLAGNDGFFYLSNRCLFEVHRGGPPKAHAPKWTNIMFVRPGPPGTLLLQEGDNKHGDVGKLYFPADGTFIHIEPELFDDSEYEFIYWSESDRFIVLHRKFMAIASSTVFSLPRHNSMTGRRAKV